MQDKHLFEYAVIRVVPRVEREEFINVGVVLYCKKQKFLQALCHLDKDRLKALSPATDIDEVEHHLQAFVRIARGGADAGPIGKLDEASRFRWLTAVRSTVVQTSRVHPGFCADLPVALQKLHEQLVLYEKGTTKTLRHNGTRRTRFHAKTQRRRKGAKSSSPRGRRAHGFL